MRNRPFTLLELLVVFFLLAIILGVTGVKTAELYREQQFFSDVRRVEELLRKGSEMALFLDTQVTAFFERKDEVYSLRLSVEKPMQGNLRRLMQTPILLQSIKHIRWDGMEKDSFSLFFSLGDIPKGKLELTGASKLSQSIEFLGVSNRKEEEKEDLYPEEVERALQKE